MSDIAIERSTVRSGSVFILTVVSLLYVVNYMDRTVVSVTLPLIKADLMLTDAQLGWLGSVYYIMVAVLTIPAGILVDRWSRKKSLSLMAILWSIGTYLTGAGRSFAVLLGARGLVGIGEAGYGPGGITYATASFKEKHRGIITGIFLLGGPVGLILGAFLGGYLGKADIMGLGWRFPYFLFAVPGIILGILILLTKDYSTAVPKEFSAGKGIFKDIRTVLNFRSFWLLSVAYGAGILASTSLMQFLPLYFMRTRGLDVVQASSMFGAMYVVAPVGLILTGIFSDKWRAKKIEGRVLFAVLLMVLTAVCLAAGLFADFRGHHIVGYLFYIIGSSSGFAVLSPANASVTELVPLRLRSLSIALLQFIINLIGAVGPTIVGWFSDIMGTPGNPNLMAAFIVLPCCYLLSAVLFYRTGRVFNREVGAKQSA